ncbi:6-phosphogluconolactonase [Nocardia neocaledoniensis NBRC 108232]|uniref:6-phosphogluconolactonase (Cycloisomerase 2 family) n=1 Tax=Nocardia neocaledoniensis TaxID=236511 RepID=A0A317N258_9NOCA|nr:beta-propeller fold lactonase family protein [Nocardia neocaledoniensis]PWV67589.1 6-phosphogluconolactonase (cycloisomerase 2 family) [Nocardia neocaledoniensis]GEM31287.1 6-phosphogluconolactonase [Nocardia neocaledoniensis NBRC 108232]
MTTSMVRRSGFHTRYRRRAAIALATVLLSSVSWTAAAPATAAPAATPQFMLVGGTASGTVSVLRMNRDGSLTAVSGSPFGVDIGLFSLAMAPQGRIVYATQAGTRKITGYRIDDNGALHQLPGAEVATDGIPITSVVSPDGKRLYAAFGGLPGRIGTYAISASGALTEVGSLAVPGLDFGVLSMVTVDPGGRFLRFVGPVDGKVASFAIGADGGLTSLGAPLAAGTMPVNPGYTPDGRFVYISQEQGNAVNGYSIGADGSLTPTPGSPYAVPALPHNAEVSADGRRVYIPSVFAGKINGFSIGADGALTPLPNSPYSTPLGSGPGWVLLGDDQKHLYATETLTTGITSKVLIYDVAADGSLTPSSLPSVDTGAIFADGPVMVKTN